MDRIEWITQTAPPDTLGALETTRLRFEELLPQKALNFRYRGLFITGVILASWVTLSAILLLSALGDIVLAHPSLYFIVAVVLSILATGIFICAHDAMHGTLSPNHPRINRWCGRLLVLVYGGFSFEFLQNEHLKHHAHPGVPIQDPDYHVGKDPRYASWFFDFLKHYLSWKQILFNAGVYQILHFPFGISDQKLYAFWIFPLILSILQLFTFGTFLTHRPLSARELTVSLQGFDFLKLHPVIRSRTSQLPPWLSLLTCFHFGYHQEHHAFPWLPWWKLPRARQLGLSLLPAGPLSRESQRYR